MKKRKTIIGVTTVIAFIIVMALGIGGVKVVNANKINSSLELGIKYLTEGNYEEARLEFSKAISIYDKHEKATDLLALTEDYIELNELYANKEYLLVADLISKIKENKYLEYIESSVNEISTNTEEKIVIINEINNLDSQIQQLISENKFQEAIDLINKYLGEDLKQEYLDKLNELMNGVNESKTAYEEEQARIAEERRLEEERKAEEERKRQEEAARGISSEEAAINRVREVSGLSSDLNYSANYRENYDIYLEDGAIKLTGYWVEVRGQQGNGAISSVSAGGFFFVDSSTRAVYKMNISTAKHELIS